MRLILGDFLAVLPTPLICDWLSGEMSSNEVSSDVSKESDVDDGEGAR